jgi:hypothetical protein
MLTTGASGDAGGPGSQRVRVLPLGIETALVSPPISLTIRSPTAFRAERVVPIRRSIRPAPHPNHIEPHPDRAHRHPQADVALPHDAHPGGALDDAVDQDVGESGSSIGGVGCRAGRDRRGGPRQSRRGGWTTARAAVEFDERRVVDIVLDSYRRAAGRKRLDGVVRALDDPPEFQDAGGQPTELR